MELPTYRLRGGQHAETAILANLLAHAGVVAPHTGRSYSEALLLGVGGGVGMGYILWEFREPMRRALTLGMRKNWQYPVKFQQDIAGRLGYAIDIHETGGAKAAAARLAALLAAGQPVMAWVDFARLPYMMIGEEQCGLYGQVVGVYRLEAGMAWLDDRAAAPFHVPAAQLALARHQIPSYKNRLLTVLPGHTGAGAVDLVAAVRTGLKDCACHLASASDSFSLPALRKWARMLTDTTAAKGWPQLFARGAGLYTTLRNLYEATNRAGHNGGSLRELYSAFLLEAAIILDEPQLKEIAGHYRRLALRWAVLGEAALPSQVPAFARAKELLNQRALAFAMAGNSEEAILGAIGAELHQIESEAVAHFPLDTPATLALFAQLQALLEELYAAEVAANRLLQRIVCT